jgi:hypothetical protein
MSTMVKRVAQALQEEIGAAPFDETAALALARAAIAAMREPTKVMLDAAFLAGSGGMADCWRNMVNAALEEK